VALCGHATLASAHILWEISILYLTDTARFNTLSGRLTARRLPDRIELDFPATPPVPVAEPDGLRNALGAEPVYVGKSRFDLIVEVETAEIVKELVPDIVALKKLDSRGFMVTGKSNDPDTDFVSRFFAPAVGVDEDPVTGSAHCCLGLYWSKKLGKTEFSAWQAYARGGRMSVRVEGDRVFLGGRAITVFAAELSEFAAPEAVH